MDNRGQTIGIVRFFAALVIGGFLSYFVYELTSPILDRASEQSAGTAAAPATTWLTQLGDNLVLVYLLVSFFGLIALAIFQRRVTG
jgi:hypothetical protein